LSLGMVTLQALALPFKASKWQGQGHYFQSLRPGQGLTSLIFSYLSQKIGRTLDAQRDLRFYQVICGGLSTKFC